MDFRKQFEAMVASHLPTADFQRAETAPFEYLDEGIQVAWCGYQALVRNSLHNTTKGGGNNLEEDR